MLEQYFRIKRNPEYEGCVVFFQLGGFLEAFFNDAVTVAVVCGVTLTTKGSAQLYNGRPIEMAGVPVERSEAHFTKLLRKGYRVVLVEQVEGAPGGGALLGREVSRVLTPGTSPEAMGGSSPLPWWRLGTWGRTWPP
jgi:DNA mismatch repair protein MutS